MDDLDPALAAALAAEVDARFESEQVPFLSALVDQPSCSREPEDVEAAAALLDARAAALGLDRQLEPDPSGVHAAHRLYTPGGLHADARAIALVGHVDTVFPRATGFFGFHRDGDVARGPGVLDMKSGLSSIFGALAAIEAASPTTYAALALRVLIVSDEEVGSISSAPLLERVAVVSSGALVFEAGRAEDRIITARKGVGAFRVEARGRAAHAGLAHEQGVNAIAALARAVPRIEALTDYGRAITLNVGLIEGGTSSNTVPDRAWCSVDCRYVDPAHGAEIEAAVGAALAVRPEPEGATLTLSGGLHRPPMVASEASRALMRRYAAEARAAGLGGDEAPLQGGGSDANLLSAAGVPCIDGLGPAGSGIHQTSERCSLESLRRRTHALARFLARYAR